MCGYVTGMDHHGNMYKKKMLWFWRSRWQPLWAKDPQQAISVHNTIVLRVLYIIVVVVVIMCVSETGRTDDVTGNSNNNKDEKKTA